MKLIHKIALSLILVTVLPVIILGVSAYRSMREIRDTATQASVTPLLAVEQERLHRFSREKALTIRLLLSRLHQDVEHLRDGFERSLRSGASATEPVVPDRYPDREKLGLPGYGYLDPAHGAFADFEQRGEGSPWIPRWSIQRLQNDARYRADVVRRLRQVMDFTPDLQQLGARHQGLVDLVWIVTLPGPTNVYPPYNFREVIARRPGVLDLDESQENYVRLANPQHNPERRTLWLEPYFDPFKQLWMTSCVAPIYQGDEFIGTVGMDLLLSTIIQRVLEWNPGGRGYSFLVASTGRLIAVPERGIMDLTWDVTHREALRHALQPVGQLQCTGEEVAALGRFSLLQVPDPTLRSIIEAMCRQEEGVRELALGGGPKFLSYVPVESTGWSIGIVQPVDEVLAKADGVEQSIRHGTRNIIRQFLLITLLIIGLAIGVGLFLHYEAVRPLTELTRQVGQLNWDRLTFEPADWQRPDEIGQLGRKFHEMVTLIGQARDELTRKSDELRQLNDSLSLTNASLKNEIEVRQRAEAALLEEKECLAVTLRSIGDGVITTDIGGRITLLNREAEELTSWTQQEAVGRSLSGVFHIVDQDTRERIPNPIEEVIRSGGAAELSTNTLLVARDGRERVIAYTGAPIRDARSTTIGVVLVFRDMTEQAKLDETLQRTDKLDALGILAGGIAHDFNNLLTGIFGYLELARLYSSDPTIIDYLDRAIVVFNRAKDLTQQLLAFAKGGSPLRRTGKLGPVIRESARFAISGSQAACEFQLDEDLWPVDFDRGQLGQVIDNLVINAQQAMPDGGTITISARNVLLGEHPLLAPGNYVEITVADTGIGIPKELQKRIFDPFFTTKSKGNGLGLTTCHAVVKKHDGSIEVESVPGKGARFRVLLPASRKSAIPVSKPQLPAHHGQGPVLVLDDEPFVRNVLRMMLETMGYRVSEAKDGDEALQQLTHGGPLQFAIFDLTVPGGKGGRETIAEVRRLNPTLLVFASSGYSEDPVMARPRDFGFTDSIRKPFLQEELVALLNRHLSPSG